MPRRLHAITLLVLAACSPQRRRTPDDTLVLAIETTMNTADPRFAITNYDAKLGHLIAPGLTSVDTPTDEARLDLAASIEHVDATTVDITLREGVRFSDGSPVTAEDVARTYASVLDPACGSTSHTNISDRYTSVEARGDRLVRFHLKQPLGTLMTDLEFGILSFHGVAPGECHPPIVGAGAYKLRELDSEHVVLDANPYATVRPRLPHVEIKFVKDASARILMLVGGSADLLQNSARLDLIDDIALRPRVQVHSGASVLLTYLMMNNEDPVLRDLRVREAIALAIDRPALVRAKFEGRAQLATSLLPPTHWAYNPDIPHWDRDLPRAEHLLDEAGYPPGADGMRLHLVYKTSADAFRVTIAHIIANQLADAGIDVEVRAFEPATAFADIKKGSFQLASMQTAPITDPDFYFFYFNSSRIPDDKDPDAGNRWRYRNPDVDRLTVEGRRETDPARRKVIYDEVQRDVARDLPVIPLWHEDNVVLSNVDVQGYVISPNAGLSGLAMATKGPAKGP